jgi:DNA modification methylase
MPTLTWPQKSQSTSEPTELILQSQIYPGGNGYPDDIPENQLYLGDNLRVMSTLLPEYAGKIDLIYADPPFFTNRNFTARIGRGEDSRHPNEWKISEGYADNWKDFDEYIDYLYPRLLLIYQLLSPKGTFYLHLDWHADAYARILLDEIFGRERLINQIAWLYHGPSPIRNAFNRKHDTIYIYSKSKDYTFNTDAIRAPYHPNTIKTFESSAKAGFGKIPDLARGKVPEDWWYFPVVARLHNERTGYPTQKPEALLERIIRASSTEGDLVADFFCGSGTTLLIAARLGRRFLGTDATWRAIHTTRKRLTTLPSKPFNIWQEKTSLIPKNNKPIQSSIKGSTIYIIDPPELDYWEIDPDWEGKSFKSAVQFIRPLRSSQIPLQVDYPSMGNTINLRTVSVDGKSGEKIISIPQN